MNVMSSEFESDCRKLLDRFFTAHPDPTIQKQAHKALRMLRASEKPLKGNTAGWAAGIIYVVANDARIPFGVPGLLNRDFETLMGVKMETVRNRAARVRGFMTF